MNDPNSLTAKYNIDQIMKGLDEQFVRPNPNWDIAMKNMISFGQLLGQIVEKDTDENKFREFFVLLSNMYSKHENIPLTMRIICIKVFCNAAVLLYNLHFKTLSFVAIFIICSQFENECQKKEPCIAYLVTILDAFYQFASKKICDDDSVIRSILKLVDLAPRVKGPKRRALVWGLEQNFKPFVSNFVLKSFEKDLRDLFKLLESSYLLQLMKFTKSSDSVPIPPRKANSNEKRLEIQNTLLSIPVNDLISFIEQGFKGFQTPMDYTIPNTTNDIITNLLNLENKEESTIFNPRENTIDTAVYLIEEGLAKLTKKIKFAPIAKQSQFIAMTIASIDLFDTEKFEECDGPGSKTALRVAIESGEFLTSFLIHWASFEYVRNSQNRYRSLVYRVIEKICSRLDNDDIDNLKINDNPLLTFIVELPTVEPIIFSFLESQALNRPRISHILLNALVDYGSKAPSPQKNIVEILFKLCSHESSLIRSNGINVVISKYYKFGLYVKEIEDYGINMLKKTTEAGIIQNPIQNLDLFFRLLSLKGYLFLNILDFYKSFPQEVKSIVISKLKDTAQQIGFNIAVIKGSFERIDSENIKAIHLVLHLLSEYENIPSEMASIIKDQYYQRKDARFLIPIVSSLSIEEINTAINEILVLGTSALEQLLSKIWRENKKISPFLLKLLSIPYGHELFRKASIAISKTIEAKEVTFQMFAAAVETSLQYRNPAIIIYLNQALTRFKDNVPYIIKKSTDMIKSEIINLETPEPIWGKMKELVYTCRPKSCPLILLFPPSKLSELITEHQDLKHLLLNETKRSKVSKDIIKMLE